MCLLCSRRFTVRRGLHKYVEEPGQKSTRSYCVVQILAHSGIHGYAAALDIGAWFEAFPGAPQDVGYFKCLTEVIKHFAYTAEYHVGSEAPLRVSPSEPALRAGPLLRKSCRWICRGLLRTKGRGRWRRHVRGSRVRSS